MRKALIWGVLAGLLVFLFDQMMDRDRELLCSRDDTAYEECRR